MSLRATRTAIAVTALAAHRNSEKLAALCRQFRPAYAVLQDVAAARVLERELAGGPTRVLAGPAGLADVAALPEVDTVLAAIVGAAGLAPTLAAVRAGKRILLANKEALVIGGALFMAAVDAGGATLLPIDSEHNAIFQCLPAGYARDPRGSGIRRILLTASGGPFRTRPIGELDAVTPDEACAHPNWTMGAEDLRRFGDDDEQGAGSDRSPLAVRRAARDDRGRPAPAKRHPFAGRVR